MGQAVDGRDSYAAEVAPTPHGPDNKSTNPATLATNKLVCSTAGMRAHV